MEMINGRTAEEIKAGLKFCTTGKVPGYGCNAPCPYLNTPNCWLPVKLDALALIERLEEAQTVVRCRECCYLAKDGESLYCTYHDNINVTEEFYCATGEVKHAQTNRPDGQCD